MSICTCKVDHGVSSTGYCPNCGGTKPLTEAQREIMDDIAFCGMTPNAVLMTTPEKAERLLDENRKLRATNAALTKALDGLPNLQEKIRKALADVTPGADTDPDDVDILRSQLAAANARERGLREAITEARKKMSAGYYDGDPEDILDKALAAHSGGGGT